MTQPTLIVGHQGRMGAFFFQACMTTNIPVRGVDQPLTYDKLHEACHNVGIVLLCVPAMVIQDVIRQCTPHMPPTAILADITSVKVQPMQSMESLWAGAVVGTHPLFGAAPQPHADLPVAITPGQQTTEAQTQQVERVFTRIGCRVFRSTPEKHDAAMAAIQGLNFITSVAYFATLAQREDLVPFLTPSFRRRQEAAKKLLTEDAQLFAGLFEANPFSHDAVRQYRSFLNLAAAGEISLLAERAAWWWQGD